jgi:hypothetical protein
MAWVQMVLDVGAIAGPVIGVLALWQAHKVHRRQVASEKRDIRIQVRERCGETDRALGRLRDLFLEAQRSRKLSLSAAGLGRSGTMEKSKQQWAADEVAIADLADLVPNREAALDDLTDAELESRLVDLGHTKGRIEDLIAKYEGEIRKDDVRRERVNAHR